MDAQPQTTQRLDQEARDIMIRNDRGGYSVPTHGLYPYQWNWDSAFAAIGYAAFDMDRAWIELETLMAAQWHDGMVPHIVFHEVDPGYFPGPDIWGGVGPVPSTGISQPPVAASMALRLWDNDPEMGAERFLPMFDGFVRWHRWFMDWRLHDGAVCITHPWESGRDNTPDWDGAMANLIPRDLGEYQRRDTGHVDASMRPHKSDYDRYLTLVAIGHEARWEQGALHASWPFRVADPTMTFILLRAHRDLAELGRRLGRDVSEIESWIPILEAGAETLWNPELKTYDVRDTLSGEWSCCVSNASFLCWWAGIDRAEMLPHLRRVNRAVRFGVPSHDPESPAFEAKRYWRGPVWAMLNMLIAEGLDEFGYDDGALLRQNTARMIEENGFAEYFDPITGAPAGGQNFTWTAAIWLDWASPRAREENRWAG
ncbi:hypothetical protein SAMN05421688_0305 [Poseidonocella pacifica]|uniref:Mannosylglycerate hydrolase MGH1-like glycoside hydrolase domain-containing protein n=2 Tax=Poseidonocella pacifica TaxID=871651 RepID=A0A1I0V556_9RHOB|nr:hypothetical protein SAMN05421688_0305 [Poseidonocella pacifica]